MELDDQFFGDDEAVDPELETFHQFTRALIAHAGAEQEADAWWDDYQSSFPVFEPQWTADQIRGWAMSEAKRELDAFLAGESFVPCSIEQMSEVNRKFYSLLHRPRASALPDIFARIYPEIV